MADPSLAEQVEELHRRQSAMYAGGPVGPVVELLAKAWLVPSDLATFERIWAERAP